MQASVSALGALRKITWLGLAAVMDNTRTKPKPAQRASPCRNAAAFHTRFLACTSSAQLPAHITPCIPHTISIPTVARVAVRRARTTRGLPMQNLIKLSKIGNVLNFSWLQTYTHSFFHASRGLGKLSCLCCANVTQGKLGLRSLEEYV